MKKLIPFLALALLCGCTVVSANRVFPKLAWYWSADAKLQRQSNKESEASGKAYRATHEGKEWVRTNTYHGK